MSPNNNNNNNNIDEEDTDTESIVTIGLIAEDHLQSLSIDDDTVAAAAGNDEWGDNNSINNNNNNNNNGEGDPSQTTIIQTRRCHRQQRCYCCRRRHRPKYCVLPHASSSSSCRRNNNPIRLAFLSHACFLIASSFYVESSFLYLSWMRTARIARVPSSVMAADDDETWCEWYSSSSKNHHHHQQQQDDAPTEIDDIENAREAYYDASHAVCASGALFFVFVGVLDWVRYEDGNWNVVMVFAGLAGVIGNYASTGKGEAVWDAISVHLYLLEGCNWMRRGHGGHGGDDDDDDDDEEEEEGRSSSSPSSSSWYWRIGELCFLLGSILDCVVSYFFLSGFGTLLWAVYLDMTASMLWLACALVELSAEIYFLRKEEHRHHRQQRHRQPPSSSSSSSGVYRRICCYYGTPPPELDSDDDDDDEDSIEMRLEATSLT